MIFIPPIFIKDLKIHLNLKNKLENLYKNDIGNILIYGPKGSGKHTIAKCLINSFYNKNIIIKPTIFKYNLKEIKYNTSSYYFEIILDKYFNRKHFITLLSFLCNSNDINSNCFYKLILIKNIDILDLETTKVIKNYIEKQNIRFILITSNISIINKYYYGFFLLLRIPYPNNSELYNFIKSYNPKINNLNTIINSNKNLNNLFIKIKLMTLTNYTDVYNNNINKIITLLNKKKLSSIIKIREYLYDLISKNYKLEDILLQIFKYYILNHNSKLQIIELFIEYDIKIKKSFKSIIQLEALLINLLTIL